jgi:hypothetical protein
LRSDIVALQQAAKNAQDIEQFLHIRWCENATAARGTRRHPFRRESGRQWTGCIDRGKNVNRSRIVGGERLCTGRLGDCPCGELMGWRKISLERR